MTISVSAILEKVNENFGVFQGHHPLLDCNKTTNS